MKNRKPLWTTITRRLLGKRAAQNIGDGSDGQFALVTPCRDVDFSQWATREAAETLKCRLDRRGCWGGVGTRLMTLVISRKPFCPKGKHRGIPSQRRMSPRPRRMTEVMDHSRVLHRAGEFTTLSRRPENKLINAKRRLVGQAHSSQGLLKNRIWLK